MTDTRLSRRKALEASVTAIAMAAIAGCTGDDDAPTEDTDETDTSESSDDDDGNGSEPDTATLELLAEEEIDHEHACGHAKFDDREPLTAGETSDEAATVEETHVIWEVTYEGDHGYVRFDADAHWYDGPFVFYTADGAAVVSDGSELERDDVGDDCEPLDEYVVVEPENGRITLEVGEP